MREQLEALRAAAMAELGDSAGADQIEGVRVRVLGRGGELTDVMRRMREVPPEERPAVGQLVNQIKREIEGRISSSASFGFLVFLRHYCQSTTRRDSSR